MKRLSSAAVILICVLLLTALSACGEDKQTEKQVFSMDTVMTLTAYGKTGEAGVDSAISVIKALDGMLDPELETSVVHSMNYAKGDSVVVNGQVVEMLNTAMTLYQRTSGALNPAIYPVVKAWGFVDADYNIPTDDEINNLLRVKDFSKVQITGFTEAGSYLVTMPSGMRISFGSIAKGCAAAYAVSAMRAEGVQSAVISLGGNVQTLGQKPDGTNWTIAVQDPNDTGSYVGILSVGETAVVTSGGYQRYFNGSDGKRYCHIINPSSGYPVDNGLLSVTVICEDGIMADALSTTLYVLGESRAISYYETYGGFEMVLVTDDNRVVLSNGLYESFESFGSSYSYEYIS